MTRRGRPLRDDRALIDAVRRELADDRVRPVERIAENVRASRADVALVVRMLQADVPPDDAVLARYLGKRRARLREAVYKSRGGGP